MEQTQQGSVASDVSANDGVKSYEKYCGKVKCYTVIDLILACAAPILILLTFFVPTFSIELVGFSFFDDVKYAFTMLFSGSMYGFMSIFSLFSLVGVIVGMIMSILAIVRNARNLYSLKESTLFAYDGYKKHADKKSSRAKAMLNPYYWVAILLVPLIVGIIYSFMPADFAVSYFSYVTGVTGLGVFLIILYLGVIGVSIWSTVLKSNLKKAIIREQY